MRGGGQGAAGADAVGQVRAAGAPSETDLLVPGRAGAQAGEGRRGDAGSVQCTGRRAGQREQMVLAAATSPGRGGRSRNDQKR